jgi:hypothetical protein
MHTRSPRPDSDIAETPVFADRQRDVMARPLHDNWIQPSGVFASAGAASVRGLVYIVRRSHHFV